jgi:hypothetical protein
MPEKYAWSMLVADPGDSVDWGVRYLLYNTSMACLMFVACSVYERATYNELDREIRHLPYLCLSTVSSLKVILNW